MTIRHHPSDEMLAAFVGGTLNAGRQVVIASHVEQCSDCRRFVRAIEQVAGNMLEDIDPTSLVSDALSRTLQRLGEPGQVASQARMISEDGRSLPASLRGHRRGAWRWVGFGVRMQSVDVPNSGNVRVFLLKGAPGIKLPQHTHTGNELTSILAGSFSHEGGCFAAGDFEDADDRVEHRPVVGSNEECLCLVALEGRLRLTGFLGVLLNPFVRL